MIERNAFVNLTRKPVVQIESSGLQVKECFFFVLFLGCMENVLVLKKKSTIIFAKKKNKEEAKIM